MKKALFIILTSQLSFAQIKTFSNNTINKKEFENKLLKAMDSLDVNGMSIAVINNGKIVYNKGFGYSNVKSGKRITNSTYFEAASLSKPVFCLFVLKLANQGKINLDKPVHEYLPSDNISDERYKKITARMVLSHTTGLPNWSETKMVTLESEPGTSFSYSGEAFVYLAKVIAKIYNTNLKNLDSIFQKEVADEFKLDNFNFVITPEIEKDLTTAYQGKSEVKDERDRLSFDPAGGLYSNPTNYAQFLIQLMNHKSEYKDMFKPFIKLEDNNIIKQYFGIKSWTLGLAVEEINGSQNYWHGGNNLGYTNSFTINPNKKFGYVFFTNADQCNSMKKIVENILWK